MYVLVFDDYCEDDGQKKPISCKDKYLKKNKKTPQKSAIQRLYDKDYLNLSDK
jgi:hypothetical protein